MDVLASRVLLRPRDLDASLAFYEGALGLSRFREFGQPPRRGVVFFLGGGYLELSESGPAPGDADPHHADPPTPATLRLWLQVPDLERVCRDLQAAGVAFDAPPGRRPWGLIEATIVDPDGLPLVLVEVPDDHPLRRDTRTG